MFTTFQYKDIDKYIEEDFKNTVGNFDYIRSYADGVRISYSKKENLTTYNGYNEYRIKDENGEPLALFHFNNDLTEVLDMDTLKSLEHICFADNRKSANTVTVFHHTDLDGESAASLICQLLQFQTQRSMKFVGYNYSGNAISNEIEEMLNNPAIETRTNIAFIVDLSLKNDQLEEILKYYDKVIWIDHHITSLYQNPIALCNEHNNFTYILDTRQCGCWLTYAWLYNCIEAINSESLSDKIIEGLNLDPFRDNSAGKEIIKVYKSKAPLVGLISLFDLKQDVEFPITYKPAAWLNQWYNKIGTLAPYCNTWQNLWRGNYFYEEDGKEQYLTPDIKDILYHGHKLYTIFQEEMQALREADPVYEYHVFNEEDHLVFHCINGFGFSQRFEDNREDIKIIGRFVDNRNKFSFSLYTDNEEIKELIPLGKIANKYFIGGGHPGAAGGSYPSKEIESAFEKIMNREFLGKDLEVVIQFKNVTFTGTEVDELETLIGNTSYTGSFDDVRFDEVIDIYFRLFVAIISYEYKLAKSKK